MKKKLKFRNPLTEIYNEANLPRDIRISLTCMLFGNLFGCACGIVCGSGTTSMVGLATMLGADDLAFGIISAIVQAASILQIPFSILVNRTHKRKRYLLTWGLFSRALWLVFGFIPFIIPETSFINLRLWSLIFILGISSSLGAIINVSWFPWFSDIAPMSIRGRWMSVRDTINAVTNIVFGLLIAFLLDYLPEPTRYTVVFTLGGLVGMADMLCFSGAKEVYSAPPQKVSIFAVFKNVLKNKPFLNFMIWWAFWAFTWNMDVTFMTPYSMNVMGLSALQIMICSTILGGMSTILVAHRWGNALYHYGSRTVMLVGCMGANLAHLFYLFSSPGNVLPTFLFNFVGAMFWTGCNLACNNLQLSLSPDSERPSYIAIFSCFSAFVGTTLGSLIGGTLLNGMASAGFHLGVLDRYKVLFLGSTILRTLGVIILVPRLQNENDRGPKDLLKSFVRVSQFKKKA